MEVTGWLDERGRSVARINGRDLIAYRFEGLWRATVGGEHVAPRFAFETLDEAKAACECAAAGRN